MELFPGDYSFDEETFRKGLMINIEKELKNIISYIVTIQRDTTKQFILMQSLSEKIKSFGNSTDGLVSLLIYLESKTQLLDEYLKK